MTMTECASCADERAAGAAFCESCGRSLSAGPACPHCGAAGAVGEDGYCEQCGMLAIRPRDHLEVDGGEVAAAATDRGQRHHRNEDAMWLAVRGADVDVVVCDGVSSSFDPDVASATAAGAAGEVLAATGDVGEAILTAKQAVADLAAGGDPRRAVSNPACTIVAAVVRGSEVSYGWIGDSRAYWIGAEGPAEQLTEDDSWATHVIALGVDPEVAMRDPKAHAITGWLGADAGSVQPRAASFTVTEPGHLVLCSDGLWNYLTDPAAFAAAVRTGLHEHGTLINAARYLTDYANNAGGADNITVALIPVQPLAEE
ncbi:protein phosphatase 2C domain-containing protein [Actinoplanes sp. NPDC048796]|uniref:protein phosphatase 2C domain-containing protein n=1 Tax=unclassified Actinoplanes TaxID=2626549 RepID=UPI0033F5E486